MDVFLWFFFVTYHLNESRIPMAKEQKRWWSLYSYYESVFMGHLLWCLPWLLKKISSEIQGFIVTTGIVVTTSKKGQDCYKYTLTQNAFWAEPGFWVLNCLLFMKFFIPSFFVLWRKIPDLENSSFIKLIPIFFCSFQVPWAMRRNKKRMIQII